MTPNVQGPNGPFGPNYVQSGQVINNTNNYYYNAVPDSHYQDRLELSTNSNQQPQNVVTYVQNNIYTGATQVQSYMGGTAYNGTGPIYNSDVQSLFSETEAVIDSLYNMPKGGSTVMVYNNPNPQTTTYIVNNNQVVSDPNSQTTTYIVNNNQVVGDSNNQANTQNNNQVLIQIDGKTYLLNNNGQIDPNSDPYTALKEMDTIIDKTLKEMEATKNNTDATKTTDKTKTTETKETTDKTKTTDTEEIQENKIAEATLLMHRAVNGLGTDKDTIFQVLEALTPEERIALERAYADEYGNGNLQTLRDHLDGDMDGADINNAFALLNQGVQKDPVLAAEALNYAINDVAGTDEATIKQIIGSATPEELKNIQVAYAEKYGDGDISKLKQDIEGEFSQFWDGTATGTASGAVAAGTLALAAFWWTGPLVVPIALGMAAVGGIIGGTVGTITDPSKQEREALTARLDESLTAKPDESLTEKPINTEDYVPF